MRGLLYSHPMEFADDVRRIVTETYRYCHPDDPLITAAAKLQQEFEMLFAKINFQARFGFAEEIIKGVVTRESLL